MTFAIPIEARRPVHAPSDFAAHAAAQYKEDTQDNPYFPSLAEQMAQAARSQLATQEIHATPTINKNVPRHLITSIASGRAGADASLCSRPLGYRTLGQGQDGIEELDAQADEETLTPLADVSSHLSISTPYSSDSSSFYGRSAHDSFSSGVNHSSCSSSSTYSMPLTPNSSLGRTYGRSAVNNTGFDTSPSADEVYASKLHNNSPLSSPTVQVAHHHPYAARPAKLASSFSSGRQPLQQLDPANLTNLAAGNGGFLHPAAARKAALAHAARMAPAMQSAKSMPGVASANTTPGSQVPRPLIARIPNPPSAINTSAATLAVDSGTVSSRYLSKYPLPALFTQRYRLGDELGSGGFGFVVVGYELASNREVAIKFIFQDKVPVHGWIRDEDLGVVPIEVAVLKKVRHPGVIQFIDYMETPKFSILVMELFGKGWGKDEINKVDLHAADSSLAASGMVCPRSAPACVTSHPNLDTMELDSGSNTVSSELSSEPEMSDGPDTPITARHSTIASSPPSSPTPAPSKKPSLTISIASPSKTRFAVGRNPHVYAAIPSPAALTPPVRPPLLVRRSSHDLFECIEAAGPGGFSEEQVQYIFAQVVEVVWHLETLGVCHRDIKDENIVIDAKLRVKLIDFGSASVQDPSKPPRYYDRFFGTVNAAAPEILAGRPYIAPQAEVWSLGVLLYTILFGECPFANTQATMAGRISQPRNGLAGKVGRDCREVLGMCLEVDAPRRAAVSEIRNSRWVTAGRSAFRRQMSLENVSRGHPRSTSG